MLTNCSWCGKKISKRAGIVENQENVFCDRKCYFDWRKENPSKNVGRKSSYYQNKLNELAEKRRLHMEGKS